MKKILYLTFYFEPDLSAGSFRNSSLVKELAKQVKGTAEVDVITSLPNRYSTFEVTAPEYEERDNYTIRRIAIPKHKNGMKDQVLSYMAYYRATKKLVKGKKYDLIIASSSRFFTSFLAYRIAIKNKAPLYLDIRDIFIDTMEDVLHSKLIKAPLMPALRVIEKKVFDYASHINLISGGFAPYFQKFKHGAYSTFTNGIDDMFLNLPLSKNKNNDIRVITYAGNIGDGQGLHKVVPQAAKALGDRYAFKIIGDGGAKQLLIDEIKKHGVRNVEIIPPVKRDELLEVYNQSDFLFIHLNDYDAFKKVLPSKVFELGAFDKPIIAGVAGFANEFIEKNVPNKILFLPGDVNAMVKQLNEYIYVNEVRTLFIDTYKRESINRELAASMRSYLK